MADVESSAQCAAMCNENDRCLAWSYEKNDCSLKDTMPLHAYRADVTSGESSSFEPTTLELSACPKRDEKSRKKAFKFQVSAESELGSTKWTRFLRPSKIKVH